MPEQWEEHGNSLDISKTVQTQEIDAVALVVSRNFLLNQREVGLKVPVVLNLAH
jgi:hypothetical protein